jgi:carboxylesterase type B
MFVIDNVTNNDPDFQSFMTLNFGVTKDKYATLNKAMIDKFPSPSTAQKYKTQKDRVIDFVQFSVFTCNARFITEAYKGKTYNMQYSRHGGMHGTDMLAMFYLPNPSIDGLISLVDPTIATFAKQYQSYLVSHARSGDPNKFRAASSIEWPLVDVGPTLSKVMHAGNMGYGLIGDTLTKAEDCDFWKEALAFLTEAGGEIFVSLLCVL